MKRLLVIAGLSASALWAQPRVELGMGGGARRPPAIAKWEKLGPEQKKQRLGRLPPDRRQKVEQQYDSYQKLSPEERLKLDQSYESFRQLPPERQAATRQVYRRFGALGKARRLAVREEFRTLRELSDEQRSKRLESDDLKKRFSSGERTLLDDLARAAQIPED